MKSTLSEVRTELATAIAPAIKAYDILPASPELPCAVVLWPKRIDFAETLAGHSRVNLDISVFVSLADIDTGQRKLDALISGAIASLLHSHSTSTWQALIVESVTNIRSEKLGDRAVLAADFNLTLIA